MLYPCQTNSSEELLSQVFQGMVPGHEKLFNIGIVFIINSISLISLQAQGKEMHVYQKDHAGHKFEKQNYYGVRTTVNRKLCSLK